MTMNARLNILLTHRQAPRGSAPSRPAYDRPQPWHETLPQLLSPLGVQTFQATSGPQALDVLEHHPIHLAVVDTRLSETDRLSMLRLIQKITETTQRHAAQGTNSFRVQVNMSVANQQQRVEVRFQSQSHPAPVTPTVILVTPARDDQLLTEALKFNVFTVMPEPVYVNLMLDVMARAMRRFHHNQWPQMPPPGAS